MMPSFVPDKYAERRGGGQHCLFYSHKTPLYARCASLADEIDADSGSHTSRRL
jgi:hypothetical protein